jgi:predicted choloylglycine hydrolase
MGRRGKYPDAGTAATNFVQGVELAAEKWRSRTTAGRDKYEAWYSRYFAPRLYSQIPSILTLADPYARSRRVGTLVKRAAEEYRRWKLSQVVAAAAPPIIPAA